MLVEPLTTMTDDQFWAMIASSRENAEGDAQTDQLKSLLSRLAPPEILAFEQLLFAKRAESYLNSW